MLERLLRILDSGSSHHLGALAEQLGVSTSLLEAMLDDLVRLGYLAPVHADCPTSCHTCPQVATCHSSNPGRLWTLTKAGKRAAKR